MIAILTGEVEEKYLGSIVLNVQGVGYGVYVSNEDYGNLNTGKEAKLYIYEHIRENSHDLFGFLSKTTKVLFELLLTVNGVGPKMALNMLSIGTSDSVKQAIAGGDVKFIQQANGVGKRVAERVVVDLKDKVGLSGVDLEATGILTSETAMITDEAVQALMSLGYTPVDAQAALKSVDSTLSTEERIKQALKGAR